MDGTVTIAWESVFIFGILTNFFNKLINLSESILKSIVLERLNNIVNFLLHGISFNLRSKLFYKICQSDKNIDNN